MEIELARLLSDIRVLAAIVIQFLLGLGLGYVSVRALKYILAFLAILVLGSFLSAWSLGASVGDVLGLFGELSGVLRGLLVTLGLMTVGPVSVGFIVGALVALLRR